MQTQAKSRLRADIKRRLALIGLQEKREKDLRLSQNLSDFLSTLNLDLSTEIIGAFMPILSEPDWTLMLRERIVKYAFPDFRDGGMKFYEASLNELRASSNFGVEVPTPNLSLKQISPKYVLTPGLAFGLDGSRLGRGKGFYDRYFSKNKCHRIGLCYKEQLEKKIATDDHDEKVDTIITDKCIYTERG